MTYKRLLVPMAKASSAANLLATAHLVARNFDSHIEALILRRGGAPFVGFAYGDIDQALYQGALDELATREAEQLEALEAAVTGFAAKNGIVLQDVPGDGPSMSCRSVEADSGDPIALIGGACDLIVAASDGESDARGYLEAALFRTGRPVLMAPATPPATLGEAVVIGWNRSIQAGRALFAALPLLRATSRVRIVTVTTGAKSGPHYAEAVRTMSWHGIRAEVREIPPDYRYVGEVLMEEATDFGADLLVMGAYSHSRLRERVLGGVTLQVLEDAKLPVLMAR